jgi:hypothetical protein
MKTRYIVHYGCGNTIRTNSRNAKKWVVELGTDVIITDNNGNVICRGYNNFEFGAYAVAEH